MANAIACRLDDTILLGSNAQCQLPMYQLRTAKTSIKKCLTLGRPGVPWCLPVLCGYVEGERRPESNTYFSSQNTSNRSTVPSNLCCRDGELCLGAQDMFDDSGCATSKWNTIMKRRSLVTLVTDLLCRSYSKHGSTLYTVYYLRTKFLHLPLACEDSGTDTKHVIDAKHEVHGVIKDSLFYFHPAPRFVKGC